MATAHCWFQFNQGPEAGNWNYVIFRLEGDQLELCPDMSGKLRPDKFATSLGSSRAYERLRRTSHSRPEDVTGGTAVVPQPPAPIQDSIGFGYIESPTLTRLQGQWTAVKIVREAQELPAMMLRTGRRTAAKNEVKISFGGQLMIHALIRLDERTDPMHHEGQTVDSAGPGTMFLPGTKQFST